MDPELENTGMREARRADDAVHTAELDVQRSAAVVHEFQRTMGAVREFYSNNHFAENALKIMRAPARKAS